MLRALATLALTLTLAPLTTTAEPKPGTEVTFRSWSTNKDLYDSCAQKNAHCYGYVQGFLDAYWNAKVLQEAEGESTVSHLAFPFCLPDPVDIGVIMDLIVIGAQRSLNERGHNALSSLNVYGVLKSAYPCKHD